MFAPLIECPRARPPAEEENVDLHLDVKLGDGAGGNRAVRFVDGVDLAVLPVVDGLGVTCDGVDGVVRLLAFSSVGDRRRRLGAIDRPDKFWVRGVREVRVRTGEEGTGHGHA